MRRRRKKKRRDTTAQAAAVPTRPPDQQFRRGAGRLVNILEALLADLTGLDPSAPTDRASNLVGAALAKIGEQREAIAGNLWLAPDARVCIDRFAERLVTLLIQAHQTMQVAERQHWRRVNALANVDHFATSSLQAVHPDELKLDACIVAGVPGPLSRCWQELKHLGIQNGLGDAFVCFVLPSTPMIQLYKGRLQDHFATGRGPHFGAKIANLTALAGHLRCALHERAATLEEIREWFPEVRACVLQDVANVTSEPKTLVVPSGDEVEERPVTAYTFTGQDVPHEEGSLFTVAANPYEIVYQSVEGTDRVLGCIEEDRVVESAYVGAVFEWEGERYRVVGVDDATRNVLVGLEEGHRRTEKASARTFETIDFAVADAQAGDLIGYVSPVEAGWGAVRVSGIITSGRFTYEVTEVSQQRRQIRSRRVDRDPDDSSARIRTEITLGQPEQGIRLKVRLAGVRIRERLLGYTAYQALAIESRAIVDSKRFPSSYPERQFDTEALVLTFKADFMTRDLGHAVVHLIKALLPHTVSYRSGEMDVGFVVSTEDRPELAVYIYDNCAGGIGVARMLWENREALVLDGLLARSYGVLANCPCREGCPACLHVLDCRQLPPNENLDKRGAIELLGRLLGKEDWQAILRWRYEVVSDSEVGTRIRNKVFQLLKQSLQMEWKRPVALVLSTPLEEKWEKEQGLTPRVGVRNTDHDTIAIRELPEDDLVHVITHEYTHDWQGFEENMDARLGDPAYIRADLLRNFQRSEDLFVEGFAEWVAYHAMDFYGLKYRMEPYGKDSALSLVYRAGFEVLRYVELQDGAAAVLKFIQTGKGYDFEQLYRASGVLDFVLDIVARAEAGGPHEPNDQANTPEADNGQHQS